MYRTRFFLLLMPCFCWADAITTFTSANVNIAEADGSTTTPCAVQGSTFSNCSGFAYLPGTSSTINYDSNATASFGVLKAYAQGSTQTVLSGPVPKFVNVAALASFTDTLTFVGSTNCGGLTCLASGNGTVQVQIIVGGTDQNSTGAFSGYCINAFQGSLTNITQVGCAYPSTSAGLVVSPAIPLIFGQPTTFTVGFTVYGHLSNFSNPNTNFLADFSHTATVAGFAVDDSLGNPLTSFNVVSGSGTLYPDTTVPEPSVFSMLGVSILLTVIQRAKLRRHVENSI